MSESIPTLESALDNAEVLFDQADLEKVISRLGREIDAALEGERPLFVTVLKGALVFAGQLALAMRTDVELDYVHATRYRGQTSGGKLHWLRALTTPVAGRTVLLVDDILDEGHTLKAVRNYCLNLGARRVWIVSLCSKRHDRLVAGITADFNGVDVPNRYVFGYGLDYYEQGRNLPAIYALKEKTDG